MVGGFYEDRQELIGMGEGPISISKKNFYVLPKKKVV
jgi:hypothetical protein